MKKKKNERDKNIIIGIAYLILAFIIFCVFYFDTVRFKQHLENCKQICKPDEVSEALSADICVCKTTLNIEDTI